MASVVLPKLNFGSSDSIVNDFTISKRQFYNYIDANELNKKSEKVKVAHLKSRLDEEAYSVVEAFKLEHKTVENIFAELQKFVEPKKSIIAEQFKFFKRQQYEGEPFDKFFIALKKMAKKCDFGDQEDNLLKVRIVLGVYDNTLQERLLRTPDISLDKIIDHCRATETTRHNQSMLGKEEGIRSVDVINYKDSSRGNQEHFKRMNTRIVNQKSKQLSTIQRNNNEYDCKKCGYRHKIRECPAFNKKCMNCGILGHFKVGCRNGKVNSNNVNSACNVDEIFVIDTIVSNDNTLWKKHYVLIILILVLSWTLVQT